MDRYLERLKHYLPVQVHYVKPEKIAAGTNENIVRIRESERVEKLFNHQGHLAVLDPGGREFDSQGFSRFLRKLMDSGASGLWFVVGGPMGLSEELLKKADTAISLSKMTLAHDMARLVLLEQTYRAFTIMRGEPYHK